MHPFFQNVRHLLLYLAAWVPGAGLVAVLLGLSGEVSANFAILLGVPLALVYAFACLSSWHVCKAVPADAANIARLLATHLVAALLAASVWVATGAAWANLLERVPQLHGINSAYRSQAALVLIVGVLLYAFSVAFHYLLIAFEASRDTERDNLELGLRALAAEHESQRERSLAHDLQRRLLPPAQLDGEGYRLGACCEPAHHVGGDFYDFFRTAHGDLGLVVGDVAGKGMAASLLMASIKAQTRFFVAAQPLGDALRTLNRRLGEELRPREFVALALARYDHRSGRLELANCGLPDPYLLRPGSPPRPLVVPGSRLPLGLRLPTNNQTLEVQLEPGDRLLLLTDGLPESADTDGELLGYDQLERMLDTTDSGDTPLFALEALIATLRRRGEPQDDLTALLLERGAANGVAPSARVLGF